MSRVPGEPLTDAPGGGQPSVEWIVQEVLRRLQSGTAGRAGKPGEPAPQTTTPAANLTAGELAVCDRVITWKLVQDRLEGVRRLVVPHRAVVTPAVRDELKRRGIELVVGQPAVSAVTTAAPLLLIDETQDVDMAYWQQRLSPPLETGQWTCRREILERIRLWVDRGGRAVWFTDRPASAVCRANAAGLRAYAAYDLWLWRDALAEAAATVLVLDTRRSRLHEWTTWITMLRQHVTPAATTARR